jgi:hypothetical protein
MRLIIRAVAVSVFASVASSGSFAQAVAPPFDQFYSLDVLGLIDDVPTPYGGLVIKNDDPNTLLIGGLANQNGAAIYAVPLIRSCGKIVGFAGPGVLFATAPNIDGGLAYGPDGILFFTRYSMNGLGQILPGSTEPDRLINLNDFGIPASVGAVNFIPAGLPNAGACRLMNFNGGSWSGLTLQPAGDGTYEATAGEVRVPSAAVGPEGFVYIPAGSPEFPNPTLLVSEYSAARVSAFEIDANSDPIPSSQRSFVTGFGGAEGAAVDPLTGDFLFSTFNGGGGVIVVRGFTRPCPGDVTDDGAVNFSDLNTVLANFGLSADPIEGDTNGDCVVNFSDLNVVLAAFGEQCD